MSKPIFILNGPNLNLLGTREPHIYGATTLAEVEAMCRARAKELGVAVSFRQSNSEGELVEWIQEAIGGAAGLIINPAAYTYTSIAILDALKMIKQPIIELHISNAFQREEFRQRSFVSLAATAVICGLGARGYPIALGAMVELIKSRVAA